MSPVAFADLYHAAVPLLVLLWSGLAGLAALVVTAVALSDRDVRSCREHRRGRRALRRAVDEANAWLAALEPKETNRG